VEEIHAEMLEVIGWMNRDLPEWVAAQERFDTVCTEIRSRMDWEQEASCATNHGDRFLNPLG